MIRVVWAAAQCQGMQSSGSRDVACQHSTAQQALLSVIGGLTSKHQCLHLCNTAYAQQAQRAWHNATATPSSALAHIMQSMQQRSSAPFTLCRSLAVAWFGATQQQELTLCAVPLPPVNQGLVVISKTHAQSISTKHPAMTASSTNVGVLLTQSTGLCRLS